MTVFPFETAMHSATETFPQTPNVKDFLSEGQYRLYDTLLAVTLTLCIVVGLPGNILSLLYFGFYSTTRKNFSSLTYTLVCSIDICTCVVQTPVLISLYNARRPGIFGETVFCTGWSVVFYYLQEVSMFLVMLLSVSRTIKIIFLRYKIRQKFLVVSFLLYTGFIILRFVMILLFVRGSEVFVYSKSIAYCSYVLEEAPFSYIDQLINAICLGCSPIVTSVSFIVFVVMVSKQNRASKMNSKKRQAALTMAMFTFLFLACNLPCLLNNILWFITELEDRYPEPFYGGKFMFFYSWLISDIVCTVLNATLNPVLYFCRMKSLRDWLQTLAGGTTHLGDEIRLSAPSGPNDM